MILILKYVVATLLSLVITGSLAAQQPVELRGRVLSEAMEPVADAEICVPGLRRTAISDGQGRFALAVPSGKVELRVERIGYAPATVWVESDAPGAGDIVRVVLRATPLTLPGQR